MNKADIVDRIAGACNFSKAQAVNVIDTATDSVMAALKKGDRVALPGFRYILRLAAQSTKWSESANWRDNQDSRA